VKLRMVDRIVHWEPRRVIRGIKAVSFEEYQLRDALGDEAVLPESLVMDAMLQLGNWLAMLSTDYAKLAIGVQWDEVRFFRRLRPGQRLHVEIVIQAWRDDSFILDGSATDGRDLLAAARRCVAALVPLADYHDPNDLRVLFSEIYGCEASSLA
jgi:3-hydroxymyristoyl/3-hydroxydecanoyl-(acyl carrier protein) dehydratase